MKVLHIGICANNTSISKAFKSILKEKNYKEIYCFIPNVNEISINTYNEFKPDLIFLQLQDHKIINNQTLDYFKSNGSKVINWTGDKRTSIPRWMIDAAPFVDITSFSNMEDVRNFNGIGYNSKYLEIGYDETIYTNKGTKYPCQEIIFMGNNYGNNYFPMSKFRYDIAEYLKFIYQNKFGLYGHGWINANGDINYSQSIEAQYYRGCNIAINCSHFNVARYNSDRLLRILGSGTFCLSYKHPEMEQDYENYKHLVYFESLEDLKNKIDYYLENEEERKEIAKNGRKLVLNRNTFKHMVKNILEL